MRKGIILMIGLIAVSVGVAPIAWAEIQPSEGPPGTTVTIGGGKFGEFQGTHVNQVEFNGVQALIQLWERDLIIVKVPLHAQNGPLTVRDGSQSIQVGSYQQKLNKN